MFTFKWCRGRKIEHNNHNKTKLQTTCILLGMKSENHLHANFVVTNLVSWKLCLLFSSLCRQHQLYLMSPISVPSPVLNKDHKTNHYTMSTDTAVSAWVVCLPNQNIGWHLSFNRRLGLDYRKKIPMLINKDFITWLLIRSQSIRCHDWKFLSNNIDLTWIFFSNPGLWIDFRGFIY